MDQAGSAAADASQRRHDVHAFTKASRWPAGQEQPDGCQASRFSRLATASPYPARSARAPAWAISRTRALTLEPPKNIPGPNFIAQFRFDAATGRLSPNAPFKLDRGHNSIAGFAVDPAGRLTPAGHAATEAVPTAFGLDSRGTFLYAAGTASGRLASYRVDGETGALTPLEIYTVGRRPAAVLAVPLGR